MVAVSLLNPQNANSTIILCLWQALIMFRKQQGGANEAYGDHSNSSEEYVRLLKTSQK